MTPTELVIENLRRLCEIVLEPLRKAIDSPIVITSGYRPYKLNRLIGGSITSVHMDGRAADCRAIGIEPRFLCLKARDLELKYDQNIHEFGRWSHFSVASLNTTSRQQDLTAYRENRETKYASGIYKIEDLQNV